MWRDKLLQCFGLGHWPHRFHLLLRASLPFLLVDFRNCSTIRCSKAPMHFEQLDVHNLPKYVSSFQHLPLPRPCSDTSQPFQTFRQAHEILRGLLPHINFHLLCGLSDYHHEPMWSLHRSVGHHDNQWFYHDKWLLEFFPLLKCLPLPGFVVFSILFNGMLLLDLCIQSIQKTWNEQKDKGYVHQEASTLCNS